ncbi:hypothetical protein QDR37_14290 [Amnibacterium sp. CER49]|nr:hypothetical protein [Amnibacterium sp. CER49]MDH2445119.1 hypothetical protein [Amnibacterium sp. CER49]
MHDDPDEFGDVELLNCLRCLIPLDDAGSEAQPYLACGIRGFVRVTA